MGHCLVWAFLSSPTVELSPDTSWPDSTGGKWLSVCTQFQAGSQRDHQDGSPAWWMEVVRRASPASLIVLGERQHGVVRGQLGKPTEQSSLIVYS